MIAVKAVTALSLLFSAHQPHPGIVGPGVERAVAQHGSAQVVVAFRAAAPRTLASTRSTVRAVRSRVLARAGTGFRPTTHWDAVLGVAGRVTVKGLRRLAADPEVRRIDLDIGGHAADLQADPLIHADQARAAGYTGNGVTVAILDSGMQLNHPDLADSLLAQHCFVASPGSCPNGLSEQSGSGSGRDDNGHGTNVAGIVTGNGTIAPIGVAPAAKVVIVRVLAADGSFSTTTQVLNGLQWVLDHPEYGVKVINMSLGTNALYAGTCDNVGSFAMNFASVVHSLRLQGVTIFSSSGNQQALSTMVLPACLSEVVAVGAVYDSAYGSDQFFCTDPSAADKVTCFSNSSTALDLLAPGAATTSTGLGSSTSTYKGTSQASPMAAAAAADLLQARASITPAEVESTLKSTGTLITDSRNGRITPRIDVMAAINAVINPPPPPPPPPPP
nr:S8 family serine peptidase [Actinomycetota bacterium]